MPQEMTADFVIVGSGAGGAPLAARLALRGFDVVVLEAGGDGADQNLNYQVPAFHGRASEDPAMSWEFFVRHYSRPERQGSAYDSKFDDARGGVFYPRAATLGGCTAHHAMITVAAHDGDWDSLAALTGNDSWRADRMRAYFERLENCGYLPRPFLPLGNPGRHGFGGWLNTELADTALAVSDPELVRLVFSAAVQTLAGELLAGGGVERAVRRLLALGDPVELASALASAVTDPVGTLRGLLARHVDPNDWRVGVGEGVYGVPVSTRHGERHGPREFLLRAARAEGVRLRVVTRALAKRVVLDGGRRATGVEFFKGAGLYRADPNGAGAAPPEEWVAHARREVVVCGGAFNTPQLLMLSGVGPREHLEEVGVECLVPLGGVGKNLQDRYEVGVVSQMGTPFSLLAGCEFRETDPPDPCLREWQEHRTGLYATNGAVLAVVRRSRPDLADPDLFLFGLPGSFHGYFPGYSDQLEARHDRFTWAVLKGHTRNRAGEVRLRSADPRDVPAIDFRYFDDGTTDGGADAADLDAVLTGVKFVRDLMGGPLLAGRVTATELLPGVALDDDDKVREFIRREAWGHHASCTCPIGPDGDPTAVLDSRFRVRGAKGLRVVDASVFPKIPGFFLVTPVYMVSEKAADVIAEENS